MTINEFIKLIDKAESAIAENKDPTAALIFLHKLLDAAGSAAYYAMFFASSEAKKIALNNARNEAFEHAERILGLIQDMVREERNA